MATLQSPLTSSAPAAGVTTNLGAGANFTTSAKDTLVSATSPAMRIAILINTQKQDEGCALTHRQINTLY